MATLLEKARQQAHKRKVITNEEMDLALAFIRGEVSLSAVGRALGAKKDNTASAAYTLIARAVQQAHSRGIIKI